MARWFETNRTRLRLGRQEDAEALFTVILDPLHVDALGEALRAWLVESEAIDRGIDEVPSQHPANSEAGGITA